MAKKLTRGLKAVATRKANQNSKTAAELLEKAVHYDFSQQANSVYSLSKALDNSLDRLEQRMADFIARVDRILA